MADLRVALTQAGITDATTLLQSGNVIAQSNAEIAAFTDIVETTIHASFGFWVDVIVRDESSFLDVLDNNVFSPNQLENPKLAHVAFLKSTPIEGGLADLRQRSSDSEEITLIGREVFLYYGDGSARSGLSNAAIEQALGTPATSRNWNTVGKIAAAIS